MKLTVMRRALEDADIKDEAVVIKGPLSDEFTKTLNEEYAKKPDGEDGAVATESQANDALAMQSLARAISDQVNPPEPSAPVVFAADAGEVTNEDIIALTMDMINQDADDSINYALVLDTTTPEMQSGVGDGADGTAEKFIDLSPRALAMESIAKAHGVKVYRSLEAYAIDRYIR